MPAVKNCVELVSKESCANCGACSNACTHNAITVDKESLFYAVSVDSEKCINCGTCISVCPIINEEKMQNVINAYGFISNDRRVVKKSSSGGAFSEIAQYVLNQGGIVWGAVYDKDHKSVVFGSTQDYELDELRRSKYVESIVGDSYKRIREQLSKNNLVLFCGTPCEVAGLKSFLRKKYDNLITCDFACGGLPSHKIYEQYLNELEGSSGKVSDIDFRPKIFGWTIHSIRVQFNNRKQYKRAAKFDPYFYPFLFGGYSKRRNCLDCRFSNNHYSDIILADFWLYRKIGGYGLNESGISLVITNSKKGDTVIQRIKGNADVRQLDINEATYNLKACYSNEKNLKERDNYLRDFAENGVQEAAIKAGMPVNYRLSELKARIVLLRRIILQRLGA